MQNKQIYGNIFNAPNLCMLQIFCVSHPTILIFSVQSTHNPGFTNVKVWTTFNPLVALFIDFFPIRFWDTGGGE